METHRKLTRKGDGLTKMSSDHKWLEYDKNGMNPTSHNEIAVGRSLLLSPFNPAYTWQTTEVVKIVEDAKNKIEFTTMNSHYTLEILEGAYQSTLEAIELGNFNIKSK